MSYYFTFSVIGEVQQQRLEAASVGPKLVPHDLTEQDYSHVIIHLTPDRTQVSLRL